MLIFSGAAILVWSAELALAQHGRDQAVFLVVAEIMLDGGVPYKDAWDIKPQGIYYHGLLARVLFGEAPHALRLLEVLAWASLIGAFMVLSRRYIGDARVGLLGGALALTAHAQLGYWHTAQPESIGAVYLSWGFVLAGARPEAQETRLYHLRLS